MVEIFNSIANIAKNIENDIFQNCSDFLESKKSDEEMHLSVYNHCSSIIESEFEKTRSVHRVIGQDKKQFCQIYSGGKYIVAYKAIDSIHLLDVNFSLGSIFAIYEYEVDSLHLKAASYVTYGPTFQLVFASKTEGVKFFHHEEGEFVQQESFTLNAKGNINSTGGDASSWSDSHQALLDSFFDEGYRLRFSDSLALDTHQILFKKGGIYSNPKTLKDPQGKIELLFEAYPIAFIVELAGGEAIDGEKRILDLRCEDIHQRTPLYFGSKYEIERVKNWHK